MTELTTRAIDERYDLRMAANRMRAAADALLSNLSRDQLVRACFPFEAEAERRDWDFIPKYRPNGLPLREMDSRQQVLAQQLLATGLSLTGYAQVISIMNFENVLREMNKDRMGLVASEVRNSGKYLFSFFGEPQAEQTWGWRMVGHHVSLNYTIVDGYCLAHTPMLFGAEPAEFGVFKPMKDDEDRGFDLLYSLTPEQRARAIIHDVAPPDFVTRVIDKLGDEELPGDHELGFDNYVISDHDRQMLKWVRSEAKGVAASEMDPSQFERFRNLLIGYVNRLPQDVASVHMERLAGLGLEKFTFAWAGQPERGRPHYYRIQGPEFLVEFENAQRGGGLPEEANHIHTVWRDPENDFGDDLLLRHYAQEHLPYIESRLRSSRARND
ncbi:MAG TPA: DUF3500 domain-containing protein [Dehalococcoidia bacterium]|nr:DUF3500 domain-containing protein [Dehalococcoidia bacterium]